MLGSWLFWLTATAMVLLVPALVALLRVDRHAHKAAPRALERRVGLVAATTLVAVAALLVSALLGAGRLGAVLVALAVAGSVVESARGRRGWAVRGIVTRGLLLAGTVSALLRLGDQALDPPGTVLGGLLLGGGWGLAAWSAVRLRRPVEGWLGARATLEDPVESARVDIAPVPLGGGTGTLAGSPRRPVLGRTGTTLAAFVVPAAAVAAIAAVAGGRPAPDPEPPASQAGGEGAPRRSTAPSSRPTSGSAWHTAPSPTATPARTLDRSRSTGELTGVATPSPLGEEASPEPAASETTATDIPTRKRGPGDRRSPTVIPMPTGWPHEGKTPGYAKEKPNRPSGAPSPGGGNG